MSRKIEEWRDIPGYDGWYQVSDWGNIRSFRCRSSKTGKKLEHPVRMNPQLHNGVKTVWFWAADGTTHRYNVAKLVFDVWMGSAPAGSIIRPKDGNPKNVSRWNLKIVARSEFVKKNDMFTGRKFPVLKLDTSLQVVAAYRSAAHAERANHYSKKVLADYCNLKRASVIAGDGYIYAWDDDKWLRKTLERAKAELDALGIRYNDTQTERYYDLQTAPNLELDPDIVWSEAPPLRGGGTPLELT